MKKTLFFFLFGLMTQLAFAQKEPVVMTINDKPVTKAEFLQIYTKNNPSPSFDKDSLDRYMQLFEVFKLKMRICLLRDWIFIQRNQMIQWTKEVKKKQNFIKILTQL